MFAMRRRLSTLAIVWILFQIAGTSAPLTLLATGAQAAEICTCPSADHGATCPMHHPQGANANRDGHEQRCKLQNACAPADAALLSLAGGAGLVSAAVSCTPSDLSVATIATPATNRLSRGHTPDSPPPRA